MTRPTYSQTTLAAMTIAQLKSIAHQLGAMPDGDRRVKQTWVCAIIDRQAMERAEGDELLEVLPLPDVMERAVEADVSNKRPIDREVDVTLDVTDEGQVTNLSPACNKSGIHVINLPPARNKSEASIVLIALVAILSAVCLAPIALGILTYRSIRSEILPLGIKSLTALRNICNGTGFVTPNYSPVEGR